MILRRSDNNYPLLHFIVDFARAPWLWEQVFYFFFLFSIDFARQWLCRQIFPHSHRARTKNWQGKGWWCERRPSLALAHPALFIFCSHSNFHAADYENLYARERLLCRLNELFWTNPSQAIMFLVLRETKKQTRRKQMEDFTYFRVAWRERAWIWNKELTWSFTQEGYQLVTDLGELPSHHCNNVAVRDLKDVCQRQTRQAFILKTTEIFLNQHIT